MGHLKKDKFGGAFSMPCTICHSIHSSSIIAVILFLGIDIGPILINDGKIGRFV